jgi:hypothetical protein
MVAFLFSAMFYLRVLANPSPNAEKIKPFISYIASIFYNTAIQTMALSVSLLTKKAPLFFCIFCVLIEIA